MKHKRKLLWLSLVALLFIVFTTACGNKETIFLKMDNTTATLNKKVEAKFTFKTNKGNKYTVTDVKTGQKLGTKKADSGNEELTLFDVGKYKLTVYFNGDKKSKIITVKPLRIKASELTGESSSSKNKSESKSKAMNFGQGDMVGNGDMVASITVNSVQLVGPDDVSVTDVSHNYDGMQQYAIVNYTVKAIKVEIPLDDFDGSELSIADSNGTIGTQSSNRDPGTPDTLSEGQSADLRIGVGLKHSGNDITVKFNNLTWKGQAQ